MSLSMTVILAGAAGGASWAGVTLAATWWFNRRVRHAFPLAPASRPSDRVDPSQFFFERERERKEYLHKVTAARVQPIPPQCADAPAGAPDSDSGC